MAIDKPPFNLSATIRAVLDESTESDPHLLAKDVLSRIRRSDRDEALAQALPALVRQQFGRSQAPLVPYEQPAAPASVGLQSTNGGGPTTSRKVTGIREAWREVLRQRVQVGESYKAVADCGIADLEAAAEAREEHARRTMARAEQLRVLAGLLREHGVDTVGELPDAIVRGALVGAAA